MEQPNEVPTNLKHHPIIGVNNYSEHDGLHKYATDARALSVGISQWSSEEDGIKEISAKVFRHKGNRWSRQSEELPLHRCFDLCILIIQAIQRSIKGEFFETKEDDFGPYVLDGRENELELIKRFYEKQDEKDLRKKMEKLKELLDKFLSQK